VGDMFDADQMWYPHHVLPSCAEQPSEHWLRDRKSDLRKSGAKRFASLASRQQQPLVSRAMFTFGCRSNDFRPGQRTEDSAPANSTAPSSYVPVLRLAKGAAMEQALVVDGGDQQGKQHEQSKNGNVGTSQPRVGLTSADNPSPVAKTSGLGTRVELRRQTVCASTMLGMRAVGDDAGASSAANSGVPLLILLITPGKLKSYRIQDCRSRIFQPAPEKRVEKELKWGSDLRYRTLDEKRDGNFKIQRL
jgi:hypothetical protein